MNEITPRQWLAGVADTDERPEVREKARETLGRIAELETLGDRLAVVADEAVYSASSSQMRDRLMAVVAAWRGAR